MKFELPNDHGLPEIVVESDFIHRVDGNISLTDAQYFGIDEGAGRGEGLLLVAPTSSGKTEVGLIAAATWLHHGDGFSQKVAYLVSHRALARQKFNEFRQEKYLSAFGIEAAELVIATGDGMSDGENSPVSDPLSATFVVATYEKFLAMSASAGHRRDLGHYCIVADEVQLVADEHRGRDIEVLLTIIRQANPGQFVGLSAVLTRADAENLAGWLGISPVIVGARESPLQFDLCAPEGVYRWRTDHGRDPAIVQGVDWADGTLSIVEQLLNQDPPGGPVAVFCMTKRRVEDLAQSWLNRHELDQTAPAELSLPFDEETQLSNQIALLVSVEAGLHSADLIESERDIVEQRLERDELSVVFATTTLAQGLNYSFRTVVFDSWMRWNFERHEFTPLPKSEFHNMAGRAGRMGRAEEGQIIFRASNNAEVRAALRYLTTDLEDQIAGRIDPDFFGQVSLQLLASGIVDDRDGLETLLLESLSAHVAGDQIAGLRELWSEKLDDSIAALRESGFLD